MGCGAHRARERFTVPRFHGKIGGVGCYLHHVGVVPNRFVKLAERSALHEARYLRVRRFPDLENDDEPIKLVHFVPPVSSDMRMSFVLHAGQIRSVCTAFRYALQFGQK